MPTARVGAVDADVAAVALADDVAASRHHRAQHGPPHTVGVLDLELAALARQRSRRGRVGGAAASRRQRGVGLGPAPEHAHLVRPWRRRRRGAQRSQQLGVLGFVGLVAGVRIEQAGELREVDRGRIRQAADDLAGKVALHLLRLELVHELLQQLARRGSAGAAHADRREHEAVAVGDDHVLAHVARDEVLELLAHRRNQRAVRADLVGVRQRRLRSGGRSAIAALGAA